jgi:hypothetical protein
MTPTPAAGQLFWALPWSSGKPVFFSAVGMANMLALIVCVGMTDQGWQGKKGSEAAAAAAAGAAATGKACFKQRTARQQQQQRWRC